MEEATPGGGTARIDADRTICAGTGVCVQTAPDVFDQDDAEGLVIVRLRVVNGNAMVLARDAVDLCPSGALSLTDLDGGSPPA